MDSPIAVGLATDAHVGGLAIRRKICSREAPMASRGDCRRDDYPVVHGAQKPVDGHAKRAGAKKLVVSIPESHDIAQHTSRAMTLQSITFTELWEMMMVLEPLSARLA